MTSLALNNLSSMTRTVNLLYFSQFHNSTNTLDADLQSNMYVAYVFDNRLPNFGIYCTMANSSF